MDRRRSVPTRLHGVVNNVGAGFAWHTGPERLEAAGISWKVYQDDKSQERATPSIG